jgi:hypothetical protein
MNVCPRLSISIHLIQRLVVFRPETIYNTSSKNLMIDEEY